MIHVGVDIGKSQHCAAGIEDHGEIRLAPWTFDQNPEDFERFERRLRQLGTPDTVRIGLEATGHYWIPLHGFLSERGWPVDVFNPLLSSQQSRRQVRGRKSDPDDALASAKVVRDGDYKPLDPGPVVAQEIKALCRQRAFVVGQMGNAKKRLGSLVDVLFPEFADHFKDPYCPTALALLEAFPSAEQLAAAHLKRLTHLIDQASRGRLGRERARVLREAARSSLGRDDSGRAYAVQILIAEIRFFQAQIQDLSERMAQRYAQLNHPVDSIPGIGPTTGPTVLSELGHIQRFGKPTQLLAYAGADPRVRRSGRWIGKTKMSKRGSRPLRTALYQAAQSAISHDEGFRAIYDRHRQRGKHHKVALSHVMRKLVFVIYAVMRDNVPYDPEKIAPSGG